MDVVEAMLSPRVRMKNRMDRGTGAFEENVLLLILRISTGARKSVGTADFWRGAAAACFASFSLFAHWRS